MSATSTKVTTSNSNKGASSMANATAAPKDKVKNKNKDKKPKEPKEKKPRKPTHPAASEGSNPLKQLPPDYDFEKHAPLKKNNFEVEHEFFLYKAAQAEHSAARFRAMAEESKKLGSTKDRAKAKRLLKMQAKIEELKKQLEEDGFDIESLLDD